MKKFKEEFKNGLIILSITISVMVIGVLILNSVATQRIPYGTIVDETKVGGFSKGEANSRLEEYYPGYLKNRTFTLNIEGKTFNISLNEISARINKEKTMDNLIGENSIQRMLLGLNSIFNPKERIVNPVFECEPAILYEKLSLIKEKVDRKAVNAQIMINDGNVIKKPEIYGITLKMDDSVNRIRRELANGNIGPVEFKVGGTAELISVKPRATMADIDKVDVVLAKAYSVIESNDYYSAIKSASRAINNIYIPGKDMKEGIKYSEFSFVKCLEMEGYKPSGGYSDGVNQVASTLLSALKKSGVVLEAVEATESGERYYSPDIKRIVVSGNTSDFKFRNVAESPLVIMSEITNERVYVYILGKKI